MIFPYDRSVGSEDGKTPRPTQRPAARGDARKRDHPSGFSPKDGAFGRELAGLDDPHTDNGFAEVIRKAKAAAWTEGYGARWNDDRTGGFPHNPYGEAS